MPFPSVYKLLGKTLEDGWLVKSGIGWEIDAQGALIKPPDPVGSGGNFSVGYIATKDDRRAFVKAIDLSRAMRASNVIDELRKIIDTAAFEKSVCELCGQQKMDRVVLAIASGDIDVGPNLQDRVPYIIFELADGDVRRRVRQVNDALRTEWVFQAMHHAAVGLSQLHKAKVSHQDMKPSNVLRFDSAQAFKIGDLGRAVLEGVDALHSNFNIAGDPAYAPPELIYGHQDPDFRTRRFGCDLYMFGSLIVFFFLGQGMTALLLTRVEAAHLPASFGGSWLGKYHDALPVVRRAFSDVLAELALAAPPAFAEEIARCVRELCEPDPALRGHPAGRHLNQFDLTRYIAFFNLMANKARATKVRTA